MALKLLATVALIAIALSAGTLRADANSVTPTGAQDNAATGAHGHEIGHHNASAALEDPSEIKSDLALFTFVVFLLLLAVLWKFAWGPIAAGLEKREAGIYENIAAAQRSSDEARQMLAAYETKLSGAADEVRRLLEVARQDAERTKHEILAEAKASAEAERNRALRDIESATDAALHSLAKRSADLAVELAGKIVRTKITPDEHARLVQEATAKFAEPSPN